MEISMGKDKALKRKTYLKLAPPKKRILYRKREGSQNT
jgi:hypothetical protein